MPRRPAPSSLILHKGSLPMRGQPRHTLPSVPRPTFAPSIASSSTSRNVLPDVVVPPASMYSLPAGNVSVTSVYSARSFSSSEFSLSQPARRSIERDLVLPNLSPSLSPMSPSYSPGAPPRKVVRGPWDHSRAVSLPIDVDAILTPPKPVAISP